MARFTKGTVLTPALIENVFDLADAADCRITDDQVHRIELVARVDESETYLCMPRRLIEQLGLGKSGTGRDRTPAGPITFPTYGPVRLRVQDRDGHVDVKEVPESRGVLLGFLVLGMLDLVVDLEGQKLIGNPDHDGEYMIDMFHQTLAE
jgi:hypothetical protein